MNHVNNFGGADNAKKRGNKHVLFKRFGCSSCKHFIQSYKYKRVIRIG